MCNCDQRLQTALRSAMAEFGVPDRERLHLTMQGATGWVEETIHVMHIRDIIEVSTWSPFIPAASPYEVMTMLTKYRARR